MQDKLEEHRKTIEKIHQEKLDLTEKLKSAQDKVFYHINEKDEIMEYYDEQAKDNEATILT